MKNKDPDVLFDYEAKYRYGAALAAVVILILYFFYREAPLT